MVTTSTNLAEISPYGPTRATVEGAPLNPEELRKMEAYWRALLLFDPRHALSARESVTTGTTQG